MKMGFRNVSSDKSTYLFALSLAFWNGCWPRGCSSTRGGELPGTTATHNNSHELEFGGRHVKKRRIGGTRCFFPIFIFLFLRWGKQTRESSALELTRVGGEGPIYYYTQHAQSGWARGFFLDFALEALISMFFVMRMVLLTIRTFRFGLPFLLLHAWVRPVSLPSENASRGPSSLVGRCVSVICS